MKLNWAERWVVNNPLRVMEQGWQIRQFKKMAALKRGAAVLEVGCGRGAGVRLILKTFNPSRLSASDLDCRMVRMAKGYLSRSEKEKVFLHTADVRHLPFKDGSLDAVFNFGVLHHVPDWRGSLAEVSRILKPGGIFFMEELYPTLYQNAVTKRLLLHPTEDRFRSEDLRHGLDEAGMPLCKAVEWKQLGILGVAVREM